MAYNTFDFDDGTAAGGFPSSVAGPGGALNFVDESVSFTFSVTSGNLAHANPAPPSTVGQFSGYGGPGTHTLQMNRTPLQDNFFGAGASPITVNVTSVGGSLKITFLHPSIATQNVVTTLTAPRVVTATGEFDQIRFTYNTTYGFDRLGTDFNCFLAGTLIATPDGPRPVEALAPGVRLLTATGGETTVKWLGEQPVNTRLTHPRKVNPIRITAGALGDGLPERDLMLSADHAIALDGHLINAGALVNGSTIYQVAKMPLDGFTYYHIETEAHDLLLAEGVAAKSFIDYAGTDSFANADDRDAVTIPEMTLPRISAARLLPDAIRTCLAERAYGSGGQQRLVG